MAYYVIRRIGRARVDVVEVATLEAARKGSYRNVTVWRSQDRYGKYTAAKAYDPTWPEGSVRAEALPTDKLPTEASRRAPVYQLRQRTKPVGWVYTLER